MRLVSALLATLLSLPAAAEIAGDDAAQAFLSGLRAYEDGEFQHAAALLETALAAAPGCARCAHLLGKSYGRLAEQAGWVEAIALARKTRIALEQAVALAPDDSQALTDLIRYYRAAPGFLGGDPAKADELERRLHHGSTG